MSITNRLERIEKQLGLEGNIHRTIMVVVAPELDGQTKAEKAEHEARIDRAVQEAIRRDPTNRFIFLLA
jgi:hypothetical protein